MKRFTLMTLAASMFAAVPAFAEFQLATKVPFEFSVNGAKLPSGDYYVTESHNMGALRTLKLVNVDSGRKAIIMPRYQLSRGPQSADPQLEFVCVSNGCELSTVWGAGSRGKVFKSSVKSGMPGATVARIPAHIAAD